MGSWTTRDEQFIVRNAGKIPVKQMAHALGRSADAVRQHAKEMRGAGTLQRSLRCTGAIDYRPRTQECAECHKMRATLDASGVCKVCRDAVRLEKHKELAEMAYINLPEEIRARSHPFTPKATRRPLLTKHKFPEPTMRRSERPGSFWAAKSKDDFLIEHERWELHQLHLEINAMKQRRSKWLRKTRKYLAQQEEVQRA